METARRIAKLVCRGFVAHDEGRLELAGIHFGESYRLLFAGVDGDDAARAGRAFARALAIKDAIDADQDRVRRLVDTRWSDVHLAFVDVAELLGIDLRWAYHYAEFWRKHKGEIDYWSDGVAAERYLTARLAPTWHDKRSDGRNGPGPLPFLYAAAVEAHDLHTEAAWQMAEEVMALYFTAVLADRQEARGRSDGSLRAVQAPSPW